MTNTGTKFSLSLLRPPSHAGDVVPHFLLHAAARLRRSGSATRVISQQVMCNIAAKCFAERLGQLQCYTRYHMPVAAAWQPGAPPRQESAAAGVATHSLRL